MLELKADELEELRQLCPELRTVPEAGCIYVLLPNLLLPAGCVPATIDALLCPSARDGYASRLFFASRIQAPRELNWNANGVRIFERNWQAYSWKSAQNLRLIQMVACHLRALVP